MKLLHLLITSEAYNAILDTFRNYTGVIYEARLLHENLTGNCLKFAAVTCEICHQEHSNSDDLKEHLEDSGSMPYHIRIMAQILAEVKVDIEIIEGHKRAAHSFESNLAMAYPVMKDLQAKVNGFKRHYEKLIDSMPEVNLLLKQLEKNDQLLDVIERRVTQEANTIQPDIDIARHRSTLEDNKNDLKKHKALMEDLSAVSYDGTMIWKIENYPEKKDETVNGTRDSVLSHPFYTHRYGYKLMLQAYLIGSKSTEETLNESSWYLDLRLLVMAGEYDRILKWPAKLQGTISLIKADGKNFTQEFSAVQINKLDLSDSNLDVKTIYQWNEFKKTTALENEGFVLNDNLFVKVEVSLADQQQ